MQLLISIGFLFVLMCGLVIFFIFHQSKVPYYRFTKSQCVDLLSLAIEGVLPEVRWYAFIGMSVQYDEKLEKLRIDCLLLDEEGVKGSHMVSGQSCIIFNQQGVDRLKELLDEWQHAESHFV